MKNIIFQKIISPNLINSTHLNCLFIFRLIRYYNFCEPAVRFRKIILKEKNIQLTWPASNSLIIKKLLFRPSKFKDILPKMATI